MQKNKEKHLVDPSQKIPFLEKVFYGSAEIYGGGSATLISLILLFYLNVILGIPGAIAGGIIFVSKAWDAVSDPLMGVISDNTRSKFGRRKPYIIAGSVMTFAAMLFLFAPIRNLPEAAKITVAMIAYIFFCTSNTVSQVPFCSLSADISRSHRERNKANTVKLVFSMLGAAICFAIPSLVIAKTRNLIKTSNLDAAQMKIFIYIGLVFAIIFFIPLLLCGLFTKERVYVPVEKKAKFSFKSYLTPFRVKSYKWHLIMYISAFLCMDLISAMLFYYTFLISSKVTLGGKSVGALFIVGPMMLVAALCIPIVLIIAKKKSKQLAYRIGLPLYILGGILLASYQTNWSPYLIPIFAVIMGIGIAGAQSMPWMIFPDTVDAAAIKLGKKPTGTFSGLMTFSRKMTQAIAIFIVGAIFQAVGVEKDIASDKAKVVNGARLDLGETTIRVLMIVVVVVLISIAFYASLRYKLDAKVLDRIKYFLDKQHEDPENNNLTEAELKEKNDLIDKYSWSEKKQKRKHKKV